MMMMMRRRRRRRRRRRGQVSCGHCPAQSLPRPDYPQITKPPADTAGMLANSGMVLRC
jgi:hypothetical protein